MSNRQPSKRHIVASRQKVNEDMKEDNMKKHLQPPTPAALYARVSSDRQDVDLSVSAQLRALKDFARANGYSVTQEVLTPI